ncbi:beta-ketoacyl synthase N-terminal-like domain-containing protein [Kitasatospora sp. NPDC005856]|uniref:type I polyketide synthase n=1 Tax=Kitasatospora sp. NPDC005856 TaxID=3154566 RepID=UPI0033DF6488
MTWNPTVESPDDVEGIAIIGMAGRFPGARDLDEYWANLRAGRESVVDVPEEVLVAEGVPRELLDDPNYVRRAAPIDGVGEFDAEFFGFTPQAARTMDPQQRLFLQLCWHALEDGAFDPYRFDGAVGVFGTSSLSSYLLYNLFSRRDLRTLMGGGLGLELVQLVGGNDPNFIATRVSHSLDLRGPSLGVQTACSSGLTAVHLACQSLLSGECDLALAGGVSLRVPHRAGYLYDQGAIMSPDGRCRPFDEHAEGTLFGSGGGAVLLRPLADAIEAGDPVRAVIRGSAINNDGSRKMGFTAPSIDGQAQVIAEALAVAGVDPATVGYIEAHGTGTPLGDPIEVAALHTVFGTDRVEPCRIGSVKSNIGHLEVAAGLAGLIKAVLALEHRELPPTLHYTRPNPELDLSATGFTVVDALTPWPSAHPRRAGVSALGVGGTNAHVVLEEAPARPQPPAAAAPEPGVLLVSARDEEQLKLAGEQLADRLDRGDLPGLDQVAATLADGRHPQPHRRAVVAATCAEAAEALRTPGHPAGYAGTPAGEEPTAVLLMPGQGAQYPGMTRGLYRSDPAYRAHFDRSAEGLSDLLGVDVGAACLGDDARALHRTDVAQAALFTVEYALARRLDEYGITPAALVGHSIGEYAAACLAGVFSPEDALRVVAARGRLMREAGPGAMLTVGLSEEDAAAELVGTGLEVAAVNAPGSCVVAGPEEAVERLARRLAERAVTVRRLHTAHAFHTTALAEAAGHFAEAIADVRLHAPRLPLVSAVTGEWLAGREAVDHRHWARQIRRPVRFADALRTVLAEPGRVLVECGPGRTLTTFARRSDTWGEAHRAVRLVRHPEEERDDRQTFLLGLGALWTAGLAPDWGTDPVGPRISLPGYPFKRVEHWIDPGFAPAAVRSPETAGDEPAPAPPVAAPSAPDPAGTTRAVVEQVIAGIWSEVLGIPDLGPHDNFFDLGGDSVVAVQAASRATRAGYPLTPQELFRHQTVAAVAEALLGTAGEQAAPDAGQRLRTGEEYPPLTPTQWWVAERAGERLGAFAVPLLLDVAPQVPTEAVAGALAAVVAHHEALRLRLRRRDGLWEQRIAPVEEAGAAVPVLAVPDTDDATLGAALADLGRDLGTLRGPLLRAAVLDPGEGGTRRLALVLHHFLVDNASERILLEDLTTACTQLAEGGQPQLPPVATPWSAWAGWLAGRVTDREVLGELGDWLALLDTEAAVGPPTRERPGSTDIQLVTAELDERAVEELTRLQRERRTQLDEFLLGAVAVAVAEATGTDGVLLDVEGHGRAATPGWLDLGRTIGTCTTLHPVSVRVGRKGVDGAVSAARQALRATRGEGLGYGVLRALHAPSAARLAARPAPELLVSYLGTVTYDAVAELTDGPLRPSAGVGLSARLVPACLAHGSELRAYLHRGRLHLDWWFDQGRYDRALVQRTCDRALVALRDLVRTSPPPRAGAAAASPWQDVSNDDLKVLFGEQRGNV